MHTAAKVLLIIGVAFTLLGIGAFALGIGSAQDIEESVYTFEIQGETSGTIEIEDSDGIGEAGLTFWVKATYVDSDDNGYWDACENTEVTVTQKPAVDETWAENASDANGDFYYEVVYDYDGNGTSDCRSSPDNKDISRSGKGFVKIGRACYGCTSGIFEFESNQSVWVTYDDKIGEEVLGQIGGAFLGFIGGFGGICCGILFLIIGGIMALTMKDNKEQVMYSPPASNMMMNSPATTQMSSPQYETPNQYQAPMTTHMSAPNFDESQKGGL